MLDYERMPNGNVEIFNPRTGSTVLMVHHALAPVVPVAIGTYWRIRVRIRIALARLQAKPEYAIPSCRMANYGWRPVATLHAHGRIIRTIRGDTLYSSRQEAIDAARTMCAALRVPHIS